MTSARIAVSAAIRAGAIVVSRMGDVLVFDPVASLTSR
jgi:hypothetical protein